MSCAIWYYYATLLTHSTYSKYLGSIDSDLMNHRSNGALLGSKIVGVVCKIINLETYPTVELPENNLLLFRLSIRK